MISIWCPTGRQFAPDLRKKTAKLQWSLEHLDWFHTGRWDAFFKSVIQDVHMQLIYARIPSNYYRAFIQLGHFDWWYTGHLDASHIRRIRSNYFKALINLIISKWCPTGREYAHHLRRIRLNYYERWYSQEILIDVMHGIKMYDTVTKLQGVDKTRTFQFISYRALRCTWSTRDKVKLLQGVDIICNNLIYLR